MLLEALGERAEPLAVERSEVPKPVADPNLHQKPSGRRCAYLPSSLRGDLAHVHLVGTVDEVQGAGVRVHRRERPVVGHARAAEQLDGPVDHLGGAARRDHLDRRDLGASLFLADRVHHPRGLQREEPRLLDLHARLGDALADHTLVGERLPECDPHLRAHAHQVERSFGEADGAHAVVDATGPEARLHDREAAAFLAEEVLLGDADVVPQRLAVAAALGVAEDGQAAPNLDTGRIHRHEDHRLAVVRIGVGIGDAHEDRDLATRVERAAGEPLVSLDHVVITVARDPTTRC